MNPHFADGYQSIDPFSNYRHEHIPDLDSATLTIRFKNPVVYKNQAFELMVGILDKTLDVFQYFHFVLQGRDT